ALRLHQEEGRETGFIGLDAVASIEYRTARGEETRCNFCKNRCVRTFIDVRTGDRERRLIVATCEKGGVEAVEDMRVIKRQLDAVKRAHPNYAEIAAREAFRPAGAALVADPLPETPRLALPRRRRALHRR